MAVLEGVLRLQRLWSCGRGWELGCVPASYRRAVSEPFSIAFGRLVPSMSYSCVSPSGLVVAFPRLDAARPLGVALVDALVVGDAVVAMPLDVHCPWQKHPLVLRCQNLVRVDEAAVVVEEVAVEEEVVVEVVAGVAAKNEAMPRPTMRMPTTTMLSSWLSRYPSSLSSLFYVTPR